MAYDRVDDFEQETGLAWDPEGGPILGCAYCGGLYQVDREDAHRCPGDEEENGNG